MTVHGDWIFTEVTELKPHPMGLLSLAKGKCGHKETHEEKVMCRHKEKTAIYKPRRVA